jgi:tetratricopeptide (TPR) repeat protein
MHQRTPRHNLALLIAALALITGTLAFFPSATLAQQPTPPPALEVATPPPPATQKPLSQLEREVIEVRERVDGLSDLVNVAFVAVGLFFAMAAGVSLFGFFKTESRAKESHVISIAGETAAQNRASEIHGAFLASSKETLELVNATLQLAKEASERAVKSIEEKAIAALADVDQRARDLITRVPREDDHALVANQTRRSKLISLAYEISSFEINQQILPTPIALTPHCLFIRGMDLHLKQQFEDALEYWTKVALRDDSSDELKSLAWYWIGTEQNNLADFSEAEQSFDRARETTSGTRDLELQRIRLESRFFDKEQEEASALIRPLEDLLKQAERMNHTQEVEARRIKILTTLGNVRHQAGNDCRRDGRLDEATEHHNAALVLFEQAESHDKWALFGKAEALYSLEQHDKANPIYRGPLRSHAINEYLGKIEPRTKLLAREMELICCVRVRDLWGYVTTGLL